MDAVILTEALGDGDLASDDPRHLRAFVWVPARVFDWDLALKGRHELGELRRRVGGRGVAGVQKARHLRVIHLRGGPLRPGSSEFRSRIVEQKGRRA